MSCNILSMSSSLFNTSVSDKVLSARLQSSCIASDLSSVFVSKSLVPVNFVQITRLRRFSVQSVWSKEFRNGNFKVKTKSVVEKNDEVNNRGDDYTLDREEIKERRGVQYHKSERGARNENSVSTKRRGSGISLDGSDELTNRYDYLSGFSSDSKRNGRFLDSNYKTSRENANSEGLETQRKGNSIYFSAQSRRNSWNSMGSVSKSSKNSTSNSSAKTKSRSQGEYSSTRGRVGRNSDLSYSSDTLGSRRKKNPTLFKEKMIDDGLGISESNIVNNSLDIRRFPPKESSEREDKNNEVTTREMPSNGSDNVDRIDSAANSTSESHLTHTRFDQYPLSSLTLKAITDAGYERMTVVQEATLPYILKGKDVLAKAKTGTGKTVAFLLPAIEAIVKLPPSDLHLNRAIIVLVICPTRELANQAAAEARTLLKYHSTIGVQVVIGGTRLSSEQRNMQSFPCQILVATPGRLQDHIENTPGFSARLKGMKVLVLDEADHLLDMGFRKDIERTLTSIPKQRQTLLFSATIPEEVLQICHIALKKDHEFINTVEEGTEETHSQVRQMNLVAPLSRHFSLVYSILREHILENDDYKVLIFCTTAMVTRLVADLLSKLNLNVREIHSRKTQSYRTRVSDEFRRSKGLILVTSDVSARGVDYPDVTLVIQIGVPADREQYIHRLGRTGRKGKEGKGILLLAPWEAFFLHDIKDLPISKVLPPPVDLETQAKVERALSTVDDKNKEVAYQAWLGYYNSNKNVGSDKTRLVELANEFSRSMGMDKPPRISKQILGKMGLRNVPGLNVKK